MDRRIAAMTHKLGRIEARSRGWTARSIARGAVEGMDREVGRMDRSIDPTKCGIDLTDHGSRRWTARSTRRTPESKRWTARSTRRTRDPSEGHPVGRTDRPLDPTDREVDTTDARSVAWTARSTRRTAPSTRRTPNRSHGREIDAMTA